MATNDCFSASHLQQFPQPSRPIMLEDQRQMVDDEHNLLEFLSECLEGVDEKTHELVKKLFSKVGKENPLERFMRKEFEDNPHVSDLFAKFVAKYNVRKNSEEKEDDLMAERSVDIESISTEKLERFKVKTVNVGKVKDDKK